MIEAADRQTLTHPLKLGCFVTYLLIECRGSDVLGIWGRITNSLTDSTQTFRDTCILCASSWKPAVVECNDPELQWCDNKWRFSEGWDASAEGLRERERGWETHVYTYTHMHTHTETRELWDPEMWVKQPSWERNLLPQLIASGSRVNNATNPITSFWSLKL